MTVVPLTGGPILDCSPGACVRADQWLPASGLASRAAFLAFVLFLLLAAPGFVVLAGAQPPPTADFGGCMESQIDAQRGQVGATPGEGSPIFLESPQGVLRQGIDCATQFSQEVVVPQGFRLLAGILLIMTVWTGILFMFSGRFDFAQLLNFLLMAGFAVMLMNGFTRTGNIWNLGEERTFPELIYQQGEQIAELVVFGTWDVFVTAIFDFFKAFIGGSAVPDTPTPGDPAIEMPGSGWGITGILRGALAGVIGLFYLWYTYLVYKVFLLVAIIPVLILYVSYLWAYVGVMVAVIIGPLFIPWILVPQLDWLFWSWVKSLIKLAVHMMIAAILFSITVQLVLIPLRRLTYQIEEFSGQDPPSFTELGTAILNVPMSMVAYLPLLILMWLAATKTGEMVSMVTEGSGMPGSGLSGLASQATSMAGGAGKVGGAALGGAGKAAGALAGGVTAGVGTVAVAAASAIGSIFRKK